MEDGNKKHYFVKLKREEVVDTFMALTIENHPVKVWREGQDKTKAKDYAITSFDSDGMRITLSKIDKLFGFVTSSNVKKKLFFRFGGAGLLTFTSGSLVRERGEYHLYLKKPIFRCQMRNNYRLAADPHNKMSFRVDGETLKAFDLSASGVGALVSQSQKKRFCKGAVFNNSVVVLNGQSFDIPQAEVVSLWAERTAFFRTTGNLEVGFKFINLPLVDEEELSKQIHTLARESEVRKALLKKNE